MNLCTKGLVSLWAIITSGFNDNLLHEDSKDSMSGMESLCALFTERDKSDLINKFIHQEFSKFELHLI